MTTFPDGTTTGRIMTNAGHTRSLGCEVSINGRPHDRLLLAASYGYTNAKFLDYNNGQAQFKGKTLPYAPRNTIFLQALWEQPLQKAILGVKKIGIDLNMRATGKIFWNEANTRCQPLYAEAGATVTFEAKSWELQLWGENLTDTKFNTFYFMSMGNEFLQRGKPLRVGATLRFNF